MPGTRMPEPLSRRHFLVLAGLAAAGLWTEVRVRGGRGTAVTYERLRASLGLPNILMHNRQVCSLAARLGSLGSARAGYAWEATGNEIGRNNAGDFVAGRVAIVDGWVVSHTDLLLIRYAASG
jgi:hypothetical protein